MAPRSEVQTIKFICFKRASFAPPKNPTCHLAPLPKSTIFSCLAYQILPFFKAYRLHLRFMKKKTPLTPKKKLYWGTVQKNKVQTTIFGPIDSNLLIVFILEKKKSQLPFLNGFQRALYVSRG